MKTKLLLLIACCAMVVSCSKDGNGSGNGPKGTTKTYGALNHLSIADAQYLYATSGTGSGRSARSLTRSSGSDLAQLFKITYHGDTETVSIRDTNEEEIPVDYMKISHANDDVVFVAFEYGIYETDENGDIIYVEAEYSGGELIKSQVGAVSQAYLIRKSDGGVFVVPEMFNAAFGWYNTSWSEGVENPGVGSDRLAHLLMRYDKNQNMYCLADNSIYRIASQNGITATKIADNSGDYVVDWNGYVLHGQTHCITPSGNTFKIGDIEIDHRLNFIIPFHGNDEGGFLYWEFKGSELLLYSYYVNEDTQSAKRELLQIIPFGEFPRYDPDRASYNGVYSNSLVLLNDKTVFRDNNNIVIVKSPDDVKTVNAPGHQIAHISDTHIYYLNDGLERINIDTEATEKLFSFAPNRDYYSYSFADNMTLFYSTDNQSGNLYLCQIKDGAYSETLLKAGNGNTNSSPEIIDFVQIN